MSDQLFEWDIPEKKQSPRRAPEDVVPYDPSWKLLGRRALVIGFHYPQSTNKHGAVKALCGEVGRVVSVPPSLQNMVCCKDCLAELAKGRKQAQ